MQRLRIPVVRVVLAASAIAFAGCAKNSVTKVATIDAAGLKTFVASTADAPRVLVTFANYDPPSVDALAVVARAVQDAKVAGVTLTVLALDMLVGGDTEAIEKSTRGKTESLPVPVDLFIWDSKDGNQLDQALPLPGGVRASIKVPAVIVIGKSGGVLGCECEDLREKSVGELMHLLGG